MTSSTANSNSPFSVLEIIPGLCAMPVAWRDHLGPYYEGFRSRFLRPNPGLCPTVTAISALPDTVPLHLSWADFGPAIASSLGCTPKIYETGLPNTWQVGSWSTDSVPLLLSVNTDPLPFRLAVAGLVARLRQPFILFAPTTAHLDAFSQEMLNRDGAAFFALETHLRLNERGSLLAAQPPGELFQRFNPEPKEPLAEDVARRTFELIKELETASPAKGLSIMKVFRLYCVDALSAEQIARRCKSSKTTVLRRLQAVHTRTGIPPERLRHLCSHYEKLPRPVHDDRAREIYAGDMLE
jgi:hypothetical protein